MSQGVVGTHCQLKEKESRELRQLWVSATEAWWMVVHLQERAHRREGASIHMPSSASAYQAPVLWSSLPLCLLPITWAVTVVTILNGVSHYL